MFTGCGVALAWISTNKLVSWKSRLVAHRQEAAKILPARRLAVRAVGSREEGFP
jgi:hypothetical protein